MKETQRKIATYLSTLPILGTPNFTGCPFLPKDWLQTCPHNREQFNQFLTWMHLLGLKNTRCILDVGANHGDFSLAASTLFPQTEIWLFEPLPALHPDLEKLSQKFKNKWHLEKYACGNEVATLPLHVSAQDDAIGSLAGFSEAYREVNQTVKESEHILCEVLPLDHFLPQIRHTQIDLLKIDVEGFEFEVLEGAAEALKKTEALIIEISLIRSAEIDSQRLVRAIEFCTKKDFFLVQAIPSFYDVKQPWLPVEFNLILKKYK